MKFDNKSEVLHSKFTKKRFEVQNNAFKWIYTNLNKFDLSSNQFKLEFHLKILGELALLLVLYKRKYNIIYNDHINKIFSFVIYSLKRANYIDHVMRRPDLWVLYAGIYLNLHECGLKLGEFEDALNHIIQHDYLFSREYVPFKLMEF